ncbi:MAG: hypothetical protein U5R49_12240 [Deltaproteobacteria bacterium]|nr:hypothetical protein [Deltaproteobacteria bacterium]
MDTLCSSVRKGQGLPREEAIREAAKYLGFQRITQKVQTALKNAIRTAIRRGIFEGDGEEIRRVE